MLLGMDRLLKRLRRSRIGVLLFVFCSFLLISGSLAGLLAVLDVPEESPCCDDCLDCFDNYVFAPY